MLGSIFSLFSSLSFALNKTFLRRAVLNVSNTNLGLIVSVPMGVPLFFLILVLSGDVRSIASFSWQDWIWLSGAGIMHLVVGRSFNYKCVQLAGANIGTILTRFNIPVAVIAGVVFLHEPLSWRLAIGVMLIIAGIILAGSNPQMLRKTYGQIIKIPFKAYVYGLGCGILWGLSPILIKIGLKGTGSATAGVFISYLAATAVLSMTLLKQGSRASVGTMTGKAVGLFFLAGLCSCAANLFKFLALNLAPASVVTPIAATDPIFVVFFSFLFNRKIEIFNLPIIIGTIMVVIGTISIF